ncbi:MAG TPA: hypothetical protein VNF68_09450 [Candidatus Baltobacteraceae bacterium]|nr:hypothetical protein [Candidatus Baltobacteraceae bacterium]
MKILPILAAALALLLPAVASAQGQCTHETLSVRGIPVTIGYCITGAAAVSGPEVSLPVSSSYAAPGGSFSQASTMKFIQGEGPTRLLQSVDLAPLGITGTLHLTLVYGGGAVRIENALLTPGAITIK